MNNIEPQKNCGPDQNRFWKLDHRSAICWNYFGLFRDFGLDHIFFSNYWQILVKSSRNKKDLNDVTGAPFSGFFFAAGS